MKTKEQAVQHALHFKKVGLTPNFIYRIGSAWMTTSKSEEEVQKLYKRKVADHQEVK
jgi:hypothetical protein